VAEWVAEWKEMVEQNTESQPQYQLRDGDLSASSSSSHSSEMSDSYLTGERRLEAFFRTIAGNRVEATPVHYGGTVEDDDNLYYTQSWIKMARLNKHRRFYITKKGYYGLAHNEARQGDLVCILLGGNVPFVLRKEKESYFTLIGESYTHGLMNGEAMKDLEEGRVFIQDINLK
jgi:hypothetical protein